MTNKIPYLIGLIFATIMVGACDSSDPQIDPELTSIRDSLFVQDSTGFKYFDIVNGPFDGPVIERDLVEGKFFLWLAADSSFIDEVDFIYDVGTSIDLIGDAAPVNIGWVSGLYGMFEGGRRQLIVPPSLAYGSQGNPDWGIPPNATLVYETFLRQRDPAGL